jgi:hypothetical protein
MSQNIDIKKLGTFVIIGLGILFAFLAGVIAPNVTNSYEGQMSGLKIEFLPISALREWVVERS